MDKRSKADELLAKAVAVFGDEAKASRWLHKGCRALGGKIPVNLIREPGGFDAVDAELERIKFGVYS